MSRFLPDLIVEGGHLELPGKGHRTATVVLEPGGIRLRAGDATAFLEWESDWKLSEWMQGNYGTVGLAVIVTGGAERSIADLHEVTETRWHHLLESLDVAYGGTKVPLRTKGATDYRDIDTFDRLRTVVRTRPVARDRLADPTRLRLLRDELAAPLGAPHDPSSGILARKVDVQTAIRTVGYTHHFGGRPLPDEVLDDRVIAIATVQAKLRQHPWTRDHPVSDDEVGHELDRIYYVDPWPFGALLL